MTDEQVDRCKFQADRFKAIFGIVSPHKESLMRIAAHTIVRIKLTEIAGSWQGVSSEIEEIREEHTLLTDIETAKKDLDRLRRLERDLTRTAEEFHSTRTVAQEMGYTVLGSIAQYLGITEDALLT